MEPNTPLITLDEAYWWLNFTCANFIRPSLRVWLARLSEVEKTGDYELAGQMCQQFIENELQSMPSPILEQVERLQNAIKIGDAKEIEIAHQKFTECGGSYLHNPIYSYVLKMRDAVDSDPSNVWNTLERLYVLSDKITNDLEAGELLVECGWAAYKMQNHLRAAMLLEKANQRYNSRNHQIAVVYCMIGRIYWDLSQQSKALVAWRNSLSRFETLAEQRLIPTEADALWYRQVLQRLNDSLDRIGEKEGYENASATVPGWISERVSPAAVKAAPADQATPGIIGSKKEQAEKPTYVSNEIASSLSSEESITTYSVDFLEAFPILDEVPAGEWKQTRGDRNVIGQVEIGQVLIGNEPHVIKNLRGGGRIISLSSIGKLLVVKITGNSMNAAQPTPIEDGDYVLLRRQNTAQAGDIVVAKIYDEATRGSLTTIKRFHIDQQPFLKAESSDPQYGKLDDEFQIAGLAVAVFKPVPDRSNSDAKPA
jgi:tetratricopeptide (TPR) repeat protein